MYSDDGGGRGIRTLDRAINPIHAFQACAFSRSATPPDPSPNRDTDANYPTVVLTATIIKVSSFFVQVYFNCTKPVTLGYMKLGSRIGWIFLVGAFVAAAAESAARGLSGEAGSLGILSAANVLSVIAPDFFSALAHFVQEYSHPVFWDPLILGLLALPGWLLTGLPGAVLVWKFRTAPVGGEIGAEDLPYTTYEDIASSAEQAMPDKLDENPKYKNLGEYDPLHPPVDNVDPINSINYPEDTSDTANFRRSDWIESAERVDGLSNYGEFDIAKTNEEEVLTENDRKNFSAKILSQPNSQPLKKESTLKDPAD